MRTMLLSFKPEWYNRIKKEARFLNIEEHFQMKKYWHICM